MRYAYEAIAQFSGKPAGHVCYGRTKEECYRRAHRVTSMTVRVRRCLVTFLHAQMLTAVAPGADLYPDGRRI